MAKTVEEVNEEIRPQFEHDVSYVSGYLVGKGLDMGCGNCPLLGRLICLHVDHSEQPLAVEQIGEENFIRGDATRPIPVEADYIFSSHMVEDLPTKEDIIQCLRAWAHMLRPEIGHIVLILPDMQGGRYPTVEEGGNPSHRVNVGVEFIKEIMPRLEDLLELRQIDTIPHDKSVSFDVVFRRKPKEKAAA